MTDPAPFDGQAPRFDRRAGLPPEVRAAVARQVWEIAGLSPGDRLVDIGAGTGVIGKELCAAGVEYIGLDQSPRMLEHFRLSLPAGQSPRLVVCDARDPWPIRARSTRAVFGSRSLHWLPAGHVVRELCRVASAEGCTLLIGRVERDRDSLRAAMRRRLHDVLRRHGVEPRSGARATRMLEEACAAAGAHILAPTEAARWTVCPSPATTLDAWRMKPNTLGGVHVSDDLSRAVLDEMDAWTRQAFRNTDAGLPAVERYVLRGAAFGPSDVTHEE